MRSPLTAMVPPSGRSRPRISLSSTDLPAPLAPSIIVMLPRGTREADVAQDDVVVEGERDVLDRDCGRLRRHLLRLSTLRLSTTTLPPLITTFALSQFQ